MTETPHNATSIHDTALNQGATDDAILEVVWEVSQTTRYRTTWTLAEIAEQLGVPAAENVTTVLDNDQFWDLLTDEEDDQHRDDNPETLDRTIISVQQTTPQPSNRQPSDPASFDPASSDRASSTARST